MRESYKHQPTFIPIFLATFQDPYFKQSIVKKEYQTSLLPTTSATSPLTSLTDRPLPFSLPDRRIFLFLPGRSHPHSPQSLSLSLIFPYQSIFYLFLLLFICQFIIYLYIYCTLTVLGPCLSLTAPVQPISVWPQIL